MCTCNNNVITSNLNIHILYRHFIFHLLSILSSGHKLRFLFHGRVIAKSYLFPISASALNQPFEVNLSLSLCLYMFACSCYLSRWCILRTLRQAGRPGHFALLIEIIFEKNNIAKNDKNYYDDIYRYESPSSSFS